MATGSAANFGQSRRKAERLLALTSILQQGRPVTLSELRERYDLYADTNEDSARRKFERDKAELRDLGVEIATTKYDDIPAYWIHNGWTNFLWLCELEEEKRDEHARTLDLFLQKRPELRQVLVQLPERRLAV